MNKINILWMAAGVALMAACANPPEMDMLNMADVKAEISALEKAYSEASTNNDAEALLAYYADDAISLAPNELARVGMSEIRAATLKEMEEDDGNVSVMAIQNVWAAGEMAVEVGTYKVISPEGELVSHGKYMSLFEKREGKYVCVRDIWNSDLEQEDEEVADASEMDLEETEEME